MKYTTIWDLNIVKRLDDQLEVFLPEIAKYRTETWQGRIEKVETSSTRDNLSDGEKTSGTNQYELRHRGKFVKCSVSSCDSIAPFFNFVVSIDS